MQPTLHLRRESDQDLPLLAWAFPAPRLVVSSGPLGGGVGLRGWVVNATVAWDYGRMDPDVHVAELARSVGLDGDGVGLLTAVDVRHRRVIRHHGAELSATVGVTDPVWAAEPEPTREATPATEPGTINVVIGLPVPLSDAALINLVATVAEAKAQAFSELGIPGTGTPTDSVTIHAPSVSRDVPGVSVEPFGGPRSTWGARVGRMTHRAVVDGIRAQDAWKLAHPVARDAPVPVPHPELDLDAPEGATGGHR